MSYYKDRLDDWTYNTYYIPYIDKIKSLYNITIDEFHLIEDMIGYEYQIYGSKLNELTYQESVNIMIMKVIKPYRRESNLNDLV